MELEPNPPSQPPTLSEEFYFYLLVGMIIGIGIYFLLQGISQFR